MNKRGQIDVVARLTASNTGFSQGLCEKIITAAFQVIAAEINNQSITIENFGRFEKKFRKPRKIAKHLVKAGRPTMTTGSYDLVFKKSQNNLRESKSCPNTKRTAI